MSDHEMEAGEDLAAWLRDVGRRKWRPPQSTESNQCNRATDSIDDLFRYLEELAGRELRTREDIRRYVDELSVENLGAGRTHGRRQICEGHGAAGVPADCVHSIQFSGRHASDCAPALNAHLRPVGHQKRTRAEERPCTLG